MKIHANLSAIDDALNVLREAPPHPVVNYWRAYLYEKNNEHTLSDECLDNALAASPYLVFPFRTETAGVLEWALAKNDSWKTKYYLGLVYWSKDRIEKAQQFFEECTDIPDFAPFYLMRGNFLKPTDPETALREYEKAHALQDNEWRTFHTLAEYYNEHALYEKYLEYARQGVEDFPQDYILSFDYAKALLYNNRYDDCLLILDNLTILPNEGARTGHEIYRQACLLSAIESFKNGSVEETLRKIDMARLWPENLGVGKPYDVDIRLESYLEAVCRQKTGNNAEADRLFSEIVKYSEEHLGSRNSIDLVYALALREMGRNSEAQKIMDDWIQKSPEDTVALWAHAQFRGNRTYGDIIIQNLNSRKQSAPWNPVDRDQNFRIIRELMTAIYR
ncbi:tetratricopeptide repeat protein [candidate division KSB1 bacterium]